MKKIALIMMSLFITAMVFAGCGSEPQQGAADTSKNKVLKVGATAVPHAEILEVVKPLLAKEGIDLQIVEFSDYVQPNLAVNDKELDANFFQHEPYLENFTAEHTDVKLVSAGGIHIEPMGVYSKKIKDINDLKDGAAVAIPNDPTNGGRSLLLLEKAGVLKLRDGVGVKATVQDIIDNPKNLQFKEVEAAQVPRALDDVDAAVINTNYAMQADLVPTRDAIVMEGSSSPYVNIVAVRAGDENRPEIKALIKAMQSPEVKQFIDEKYKGAVVAAF
jgi:D-methionine transport system substrate-binding protein